MKKKWSKPKIKKVFIDKRCNPAQPQWTRCDAMNPQTSSACTKNKVGLS